MGKVAHELRGMRQAQGEAMEVQRRAFQVELEKVTEELEWVKLRSTALEKEIETSKAQRPAYSSMHPGTVFGKPKPCSYKV